MLTQKAKRCIASNFVPISWAVVAKFAPFLRIMTRKVKRCIAPNFVAIEWTVVAKFAPFWENRDRKSSGASLQTLLKLIDGTKFAPFCKHFLILFQSLRQYFIFTKWRKLWLFFPAAQSLCRWRKISLCVNSGSCNHCKSSLSPVMTLFLSSLESMSQHNCSLLLLLVHLDSFSTLNIFLSSLHFLFYFELRIRFINHVPRLWFRALCREVHCLSITSSPFPSFSLTVQDFLFTLHFSFSRSIHFMYCCFI